MKISLDDYDKIHSMNRNQLTKYLIDVCQTARQQGIEEGESELDSATADQWVEYIKATPKAHEVFAITDGADLEKAFIESLAESIGSLKDRLRSRFREPYLTEIISAVDESITPDILWSALSASDKIQA